MDRDNFDCGEPDLNRYFKEHARQNDERGIALCLVCLDGDRKPIGFYTYAMAEIARASLPPQVAKGLPGYPVGAIRIGRLARDLSVRGKGLGEILLRDCLTRIAGLSDAPDVPAFKFVVVNAINRKAVEFYQAFGFVALQDSPNTLLLSRETINAATRSSAGSR